MNISRFYLKLLPSSPTQTRNARVIWRLWTIIFIRVLSMPRIRFESVWARHIGGFDMSCTFIRTCSTAATGVCQAGAVSHNACKLHKQHNPMWHLYRTFISTARSPLCQKVLFYCGIIKRKIEILTRTTFSMHKFVDLFRKKYNYYFCTYCGEFI